MLFNMCRTVVSIDKAYIDLELQPGFCMLRMAGEWDYIREKTSDYVRGL